VLGALVESEMVVTAKEPIRVNITNAASGIYYLKLVSDRKSVVLQQIIK